MSVCLFSIEIDMEVLIKKPRPVLESAYQDLTNQGGLELIEHHLGAVPGEVLQGRRKHLQKFYNYVLYFIVFKLRPGQRRAARSLY